MGQVTIAMIGLLLILFNIAGYREPFLFRRRVNLPNFTELTSISWF